MKTIFTTKLDKENYLRGLIRMAKCNGVVEPEEMEYFSLIAKGLDLDEEIIENMNALWTTEEVISIEFSTRYNAVFFLQEAFQLCLVDGSFDEKERNEMVLIGNELGVSKSDLDKIYSWIIEGIEWKKRGEDMISEIAKGE